MSGFNLIIYQLVEFIYIKIKSPPDLLRGTFNLNLITIKPVSLPVRIR